MAYISTTRIDRHNGLITWQLLEVINNMFENCSKECPYWKRYLQELEDKRQLYKNDPVAQLWGSREEKIIDTHYYIYELYTAKDW